MHIVKVIYTASWQPSYFLQVFAAFSRSCLQVLASAMLIDHKFDGWDGAERRYDSAARLPSFRLGSSCGSVIAINKYDTDTATGGFRRPSLIMLWTFDISVFVLPKSLLHGVSRGLRGVAPLAAVRVVWRLYRSGM
jgi:hypothetical protein